ncbi:hypothetical protein GQ44DRAFT_780319 [Phaeosphaeriaceae sp. PMI808]|nr:hypothetical protein GQ44DRAFT_780319 [Phaeosphaeriaceae sp. PMI808]
MSCCPWFAPRSRKAGAKPAPPTTAEKPVVEDDVAKRELAFTQGLATFVPEHDREQHVVEWNHAIRRHFGRLNPQTRQRLLDLCLSNNTGLDGSSAYLQNEDEGDIPGTSSRNLERTFQTINSFSTALFKIVQAGNQPGQMLWGSTFLLIDATHRDWNVLSKIAQMLGQLTNAMPQFPDYEDIDPTIQLRRALRDIYNDFIEFCLSTADFLSKHPIEDFLRLDWTSIERKFDNMKQQIETHVKNFGDEAGRAEEEATQNWKKEYTDKMSGNTAFSSSSTVVQPAATLPFPRNQNFTGRDEVFEEISQVLQLSAVDRPEEMRSIALYGVGGVGKTETALEYAYRYKTNYSNIFWIKSETEVELRQSLVAMVNALNMTPSENSEQKAVELAMRWLNTTSDRWLLIFDNVQQRSALKSYWPQNPTGNVIVTSQKPCEGLTSSQLKINPFTLEEGSSLVLRHMHLEEPSRNQAEELSSELSGYPLAIAHFVGFATACQMPLPDLLATFQKRGMTAEIWSNASNASLMQYERTLKTVWDTALAGLPSDSRELLHVLAFLNPDRVTEDFLKNAPGVLPRRVGRTAEFRQISDLLKRNLVERNIVKSHSSSLRIHRALQLALLLRLDHNPDERQVFFRKAYELVRASFPHRDMTSRSPKYDPVWRENIPQVISLQRAFERSEPPIASDIEFAELLADAGSFLWEQQINKTARSVLERGEKIAMEVLKDDDPSPTLASIETYLGFLDAHDSVDYRKKAIERLQLVVKLRENFLRSLPAGTATIEQQVDVGRAWNDLAYFYADFEDFEQADRWMTKSLGLYKSLGDEKTLRFRFALQYIDITVVRFGQGRLDEALDLAARACSLLGLCASRRWRLEEALKKFQDVLSVRSEVLEKNNPDVLNTNYWIGTVHYYLDQHDEAETGNTYVPRLHTGPIPEWEGRSHKGQYRLSLVLRAQKRIQDAVAIEDKAKASVPPENRPETEDRDEWMTFLDKSVYIQNGRSTGRFRGVRMGYV